MVICCFNIYISKQSDIISMKSCHFQNLFLSPSFLYMFNFPGDLTTDPHVPNLGLDLLGTNVLNANLHKRPSSFSNPSS